jgi:hypothetical protein
LAAVVGRVGGTGVEGEEGEGCRDQCEDGDEEQEGAPAFHDETG